MKQAVSLETLSNDQMTSLVDQIDGAQQSLELQRRQSISFEDYPIPRTRFLMLGIPAQVVCPSINSPGGPGNWHLTHRATSSRSTMYETRYKGCLLRKTKNLFAVQHYSTFILLYITLSFATAWITMLSHWNRRSLHKDPKGGTELLLPYASVSPITHFMFGRGEGKEKETERKRKTYLLPCGHLSW